MNWSHSLNKINIPRATTNCAFLGIIVLIQSTTTAIYSMEPEAKAVKMMKKTEDMRRMFNLPDTENVIQDYACSMRKSVLVMGRMFISQNYVCFYASIPETLESIPFRKITDIVKDHTALLFNNAINFVTPSATYYYGSFVHRDETFNLLSHLWKHPPSYYDIEPEVTLSNGASRPNSSGGGFGKANGNGTAGTNPFDGDGSVGKDQSMGGGSGTYGSGGGNGNSSGGGSGNGRYSGGQNQVQEQVKVDTNASRNALRIALETRDIGAATMGELSYQAEVIDLIERDVENIHANLDKANRLVRGIESVGGSVANAFSSDKNYKDMQYVDRTLVSKRIEVPVDIQILWKLSNDALVPAIIRLTADKFSTINTGTEKKTEKDAHYTYESIESLWVRARPLHLDIRFKDKKLQRFRLMSSYVQSIVNEIVLRAKPKVGTVSVIFEPGTRKFVYGSTSVPLPADNTIGGERKAAFFRKDGAAPALPGVFKNASDEVKQGIMQQEKDLADISDVLGDMHGMAITMGGEIVRQTEQLDRVTVRVDHANDRLQHTNGRIKNML